MGITWAAPVSSTTVLGYRLYVNEADSGAVPSKLVYDGSAVPTLFQAKVSGLEAGRTFWFSYQARNRAGWSALRTPYLEAVAGALPLPPSAAPTIVSVSSSQLVFSWTPSPVTSQATPITGYKVYAGTNLVASVGAQVYSYTYTTVTPASSYLISISAESAAGESATRSLATLMWAASTPPAPVLAVTATTRDSCTLSWTAVTAPSGTLITGYALLLDDGKSGPFTLAYDGTTNPSIFTATLHGLVAETNYRISGFASNKAGAGANTTAIPCFTASVPGVPGTPSLVSSTASTIVLKWEPAYDDGGSPIQDYQLYMDEVEGTGPANVESWGSSPVYTGGALTYTVAAGLTATRAYRFKVRAVSEQALSSSFSGVATFYAAALPPQLSFNTAGGAHL